MEGSKTLFQMWLKQSSSKQGKFYHADFALRTALDLLCKAGLGTEPHALMAEVRALARAQCHAGGLLCEEKAALGCLQLGGTDV